MYDGPMVGNVRPRGSFSRAPTGFGGIAGGGRQFSSNTPQLNTGVSAAGNANMAAARAANPDFRGFASSPDAVKKAASYGGPMARGTWWGAPGGGGGGDHISISRQGQANTAAARAADPNFRGISGPPSRNTSGPRARGTWWGAAPTQVGTLVESAPIEEIQTGGFGASSNGPMLAAGSNLSGGAALTGGGQVRQVGTAFKSFPVYGMKAPKPPKPVITPGPTFNTNRRSYGARGEDGGMDMFGGYAGLPMPGMARRGGRRAMLAGNTLITPKSHPMKWEAMDGARETNLAAKKNFKSRKRK